MRQHKLLPIKSFENLRDRVDRLFKTGTNHPHKRAQKSLELLPHALNTEIEIDYPGESIKEFLDFMTDALPDGEVYLFGGVLRDLALIGERAFNSDIDIVVEGNWDNCVNYIESLGARKNKFGGYRFHVAEWPIDIWNARETWAIKQGLVEYKGIVSLTETTVLNWDAILMNWRSHTFICRKNYLESIQSGLLDIVLEKNPDPLGMAVRVFRHFCLKDAKKITPSAIRYLANCTKLYSFDEIRSREIRSYSNTVIKPSRYKFFQHFNFNEDLDLASNYSIAIDAFNKKLGLEKASIV
ncbi:MAG: nucleotidyltransferase domain-containing protein [Sedimentisphaerales bacterium]